MELMLMLWFYDNHWFFDFKISIICFKNSWIVPIFLNALLLTVGIYNFFINLSVICDSNMQTWLIIRGLFSISLIINIIIFMRKISKLINEVSDFLHGTKKIYPALKGENDKLDFWIRREAFRSIYGISLLILGKISLIWSILIITYYKSHDVNKNCDLMIMKLLDYHSLVIFIGNIPILIMFISLIFVKSSVLLFPYICPIFFIFSNKIKNEINLTEKRT